MPAQTINCVASVLDCVAYDNTPLVCARRRLVAGLPATFSTESQGF
jgi:hypothetical protein